MIDKMTKDPAQRQAEKAFLQAHKRTAVTEYEKAQEVFQKNYERLRAERLTREPRSPKRNSTVVPWVIEVGVDESLLFSDNRFRNYFKPSFAASTAHPKSSVSSYLSNRSVYPS